MRVFGVGLFVHWLLPEIPLAAACALGAVLAPTDAVAVAAFTGRLRVPDRLSKLLSSESLLNDASGVAALGVAVGAVLTGRFSLEAAALSFLQLSLGGLLFGSLVGVVGSKLVVVLSRRSDDDPASQIVLAFMLPFAAFMAAEQFHTSGILAAVAAGLVFNVKAQSKLSRRRREWGKTSWHMVEFTLNGVIFVMLGLELPSLLGEAPDGLEPSFEHLFFYPLAIVVMLMVIRFVWSELLLRLTVFRSRVAGSPAEHPGMLWLSVNTLAGPRGTISLAAALSIPFELGDGSSFPGREIILYYATSVVFITLAAAAIGLPWLVPKLNAPRGSSADDPAMRQVPLDEYRAGFETESEQDSKSVPGPETAPAPGEAQTPGESKAPGEAQTPGESKAPGEAQTPGESKTPLESQS